MRMVFLALASILLLVACSKTDQTDDQKKADEQKQIDQLAEAKAAQIEADRQAKEEAAKAEERRIAEAQAQQELDGQTETEKVAADLEQRKALLAGKRAEQLEIAATEKARRENIAAEVKDYTDSLNIGRIWSGGDKSNVTIYIGNEVAKKGAVFVSPGGLSLTYMGTDGDYFLFEYSDDDFSVSLKRTSGDPSLATIKNRTPLAEGITDADLKASIPMEDAPVGSDGLFILKATFGALNTQRDVKDLVKAKISDGRLDFSANSGDLGGDPIFGQVKTFYIKYLYQGRIIEKSYREGERVELP